MGPAIHGFFTLTKPRMPGTEAGHDERRCL